MPSNSNKRLQRKQWLLFIVGLIIILGAALGASAIFDTTAKRNAPIEKPKTKPLSVGVSQTDRDAASANAAGDIQALRKEISTLVAAAEVDRKENKNRFDALSQKEKLDQENAAKAPPSPPKIPEGGFTGSNPFQQNGMPNAPEPRGIGPLGASPNGRAGSQQGSQLETITVGVQGPTARTGIPLLDGMASEGTNASSEFGRRARDTREGRDSGSTFNRTADDDPLSPNRAGGQSAETYIPAGTYIRAVVLNGLDAPTGGAAQQNPHPVLLQLSDDAVLPNKFRAALKNCMVTANGFGDVAAERAYIRTDRLSCIDEDGGAVDVAIKGYIAGEDGKTGMRGRVVEKTGRIMANALYAAVGSGIGQAFKNQGTVQTTNPLGGVSEQVTDGFKAGFGTGVSKAFDKLTDYYIKVAERMFPVVEIGSGRVVDIVVSRGISIERGAKHKDTGPAN